MSEIIKQTINLGKMFCELFANMSPELITIVKIEHKTKHIKIKYL